MTSYKNLYVQEQERTQQLEGRIRELQQQVQACQAAVQDALADRDAALAALPADVGELMRELLDLRRDAEVIDLAGIARHMHVHELTPQQWNQRGLLPPRDFPEIKHPLWRASTVRDRFALRTGRPWFEEEEPASEPAA